jgi:hypothetical protein
MRCDEATLLGEAGGHGIAVSRRCRCWQCNLCGPINQAKLWRMGVELRPTLALTVTVNPHWFNTPAERAQRASAAFSAFRRHLRRRTGEKLDFVATFETTVRGEPHLHVALRCKSLSARALGRLLSTWMARAIGAPNVKVRAIYDVAGWANYMSKAPAKFDSCRRYWTSRGWRVAKWATEAAFALLTVLRTPLATVGRTIVAAGHVIIGRSPLRLKTLLPFTSP